MSINQTETLGKEQKNMLSAADNQDPKLWTKEQLCAAVKSYVDQKYGEYLLKGSIDGDFLIDQCQEAKFVKILKEAFPDMSILDENKLEYFYKSIHKINKIYESSKLGSSNSLQQNFGGQQQQQQQQYQQQQLQQQYQQQQLENKIIAEKLKFDLKAPNNLEQNPDIQDVQVSYFQESRLLGEATADLDSQMTENNFENSINNIIHNSSNATNINNNVVAKDKEDEEDDDDDDGGDVDPAFKLSNMEEIGEDTFSKPSENKEKIDTNLNKKENTLINNSFPKTINQSPTSTATTRATKIAQTATKLYEPAYFNIQISNKFQDDANENDDEADDIREDVFKTHFNNFETDTISKKILNKESRDNKSTVRVSSEETTYNVDFMEVMINRFQPSNTNITIDLFSQIISNKINLSNRLDTNTLKYHLSVEQIQWKGQQQSMRFWNFSTGGTIQESQKFFVNITRGVSIDVKDAISLGAADCSQNHASLRMTDKHEFYLQHNQGKNGTFVECLPYQPINDLTFLLLGNTLIEVRDAFKIQKSESPQSPFQFKFKLVAFNIEKQDLQAEKNFVLNDGDEISLGRNSQDFTHPIFEKDTKLSRAHGKIYFKIMKRQGKQFEGQLIPYLIYQDNSTRNGSWIRLKKQEQHLFSSDFHLTIGLFSSLRIKILAQYDSKTMRKEQGYVSQQGVNHPHELLNQDNIFACSLPQFAQVHKHDPDKQKALLALACGHIVCFKSILDKREFEFKHNLYEQIESTCPICESVSTFSLLQIG